MARTKGVYLTTRRALEFERELAATEQRMVERCARLEGELAEQHRGLVALTKLHTDALLQLLHAHEQPSLAAHKAATG